MSRIGACIVVGALAVHGVACSESTGGDTDQPDAVQTGGGPSESTGGSVHTGGRTESSGAGGSPTAGGAVQSAGASSNGGHAGGGRSAGDGGSAASTMAGDAGPSSTCNAGLSGMPCAAGATCNYEERSTCTVGNCLCLDGKWACARSTSSCGTCPVPQQAQCGSPCNVSAQGCLCQCGGPNFAGCSCSAGVWQCLGCR